MPTDIDTTDYATSAAAFGATTSLSCLKPHVSQLEKNKILLEQDEAMQARYLPAKPSFEDKVESLDTILKPHVSELERRKELLKAGDETLSDRYGRAQVPRRRSALHRELDEAMVMMMKEGATRSGAQEATGSELAEA